MKRTARPVGILASIPALAALVLALFVAGCGAPPEEDDPGPNCSTSSLSSSGYCSCDGRTRDRNYVECSPTTVVDGICCATVSYPNSGTQCRCSNFRCRNLTTGSARCECSVSVSASSYPLTSCSGTVCCMANDGDCRCGDAITCSTSERAVGSCADRELRCPVGSSSSQSVPVSSCSQTFGP